MWEARPPSRPLILAHRALAPGQRENTGEGARAAFASGADAVEVDVRCTRDGVPVLHHDADLDGLPVAETAYAKLAEQADRLGYELARAADVLTMAGAVNLELKDPAALDPVLDLLDGERRQRVLVSGFDTDLLARIEERDPGLPTGLVVGLNRLYRLLLLPGRRRRLRRWIGASRPDVLIVHRAFLRAGLARAVFGLGLPVAVWTVNRDRGLRRVMREPLVWGVITDRPAAAHRARAASGTLAGRPPAEE